jgi:GNAT superfamily N-acetyltransferase
MGDSLLKGEVMANFRFAMLSDIPSLIQFQLAMAKETEDIQLNPQVCEQGVQAVFDRPELGMYYVAEVDGIVAASALTTYEWSDWRNGVVWWIQSVFVLPQYRRRGVYAGLYAHIRQLATSSDNVRGIRLYVDRRNGVAQRAYWSLGMNGDHYQVFEWMK